MELLFTEHFRFGNIFLAIVFLLVVNQLIELYQFRNMPPGPRLTSLPFIGNLLLPFCDITFISFFRVYYCPFIKFKLQNL